MKTNEQIAREIVEKYFQLVDDMPSLGNSLGHNITQALNVKDARIKRLEEALRLVRDHDAAWTSNCNLLVDEALKEGE